MPRSLRRLLAILESDWLGGDSSLASRVSTLEVDRGEDWCFRCGASVARGERRSPCPDCLGTRPVVDGIVRLAELRSGWRECLLAIKYAQDAGAAEEVGRRIAAQIRRIVGEAGPDRIAVPVPAAPLRAWHRGIDPVREIARSAAIGLRVPMVQPLGHRGGSPRTGQAKIDRRGSRFRIRWGWRSQSLAGLEVLLIDDILTTGATLRESARLLRRLGAKSVVAVVAAVTPQPRGGRVPSGGTQKVALTP